MNQNYASPVYTIPQQTSGLATASLIFGILSWLGAVVVGAPLIAIVCGHVALSKIKHSGGRVGGRGLAVAGLVLGYVSLVIGIGILLFFMGIVGVGMKMESSQRASDAQHQTQDAQRARAAVGDLNQFSGMYDYGEYQIRVYNENDVLKTSSPDVQCEMRPLDRDLFVFQRCSKPTSARLQFNRNDVGEIIGMTVRRYDLSNKFCRKIQ